jgi:hypothetical protein
VHRAPLPVLALFLAMLAVGGCWSRSVPLAEEERTTVSVENQSPYDVTIHVYRGAARSRLGIARSNSTTVLQIPRDVVGFGAQLRFVGDPLAGRTPSVSEDFNVTPGMDVKLRIPPR